MPDQFTSTTEVSYGNRVANSIRGILFGLLLFIVAFPLLWWNEGRSLHRFQTLEEGLHSVVMTAADQIDPGNNNKLIYVNGNVTTNEILNDHFFGVSVNALKLNRIAEIYQWKESKHTESQKNSNGSETQTTTYSYKKIWSPKLIDSSKFKHLEEHKNTGSMPYNSQLFTANDIKLGAFKLANNFISKMDWSVSYPLTEQNAAAMDNQLKGSFKLDNGKYFYGDNPDDPQVGSIRIYYTIIEPTEISIVGKQENKQIGTYYSRDGDIQLLQQGNIPVDSMFAKAEAENSMLTWAIRIGGLILMYAGLRFLLGPISILADFVPILGDIVGVGMDLIATIIALICGITTIGIAWVACRPLIGCGLLVVALIFFFGGIGLIIKKMKELKTKIVHRQSSGVVHESNVSAVSMPTPAISIPIDTPDDHATKN